MSKASRSTSRRAKPTDEKPVKRRPGRPKGTIEKWTIARRTAIVEKVCDHIAAGGTTIGLFPKHADDDDEMPTWSTFRYWTEPGQPKAEEFAAKYARARDDRIALHEEAMLQVANDGRNDLYYDFEAGKWRENTEVLGRAKLQVDTFKWYLSKLKRRQFGDAVDVTSDGAPLGAVAMPHIVPLGAPLDAADAQHAPKAKRGKR